jgi:hypothetical protein
MTYEEFLKILMSFKKINEDISELYDIGFDFLEGKYRMSDNVSIMFESVLESYFTEEGIDWINWFIYENEWGTKDWSKLPTIDGLTGKIILEEDPMKAYGAKDENGNPICFSFESTYEYVKQYLKNKKDE